METHVLKEPGVSLCNQRVPFYNLVEQCDVRLVTCAKCLELCKQEKETDGETHITRITPITIVNFPFNPIQVYP